jgi:hypothetical protein
MSLAAIIHQILLGLLSKTWEEAVLFVSIHILTTMEYVYFTSKEKYCMANCSKDL